MKSVLSVLLLGAVLALPFSSGAKQPEAATPSSAPLKLAVQSQLSASSRRHSVAAHFTSEKAYFWGCDGRCDAGGQEALTLEIPEDARLEKRRIEVVGTSDDPVMWVRFGSDERFYSMIVTGAPSDGKSAGPELILKGWAGEKSEQKTSLKKDADGIVTVEAAPEPSFCGRFAPRQTRVLRPEEGRFVTVRAPALSTKERESAGRLVGHPWTGSENTLAALEARGVHSSGTPVDGDRSTAWEGAFEYTELQVPEGLDEGRWVVEFAAPLSEPVAFYIVVSDKVYQAEFGPSDSKRYALDLGPPSLSASDGSCVALVQPRTPAKVAEIMGTASEAGAQTTAKLVANLQTGEPGITDALLRLRGTEAGNELTQSYGKMSPSAKARAFRIAQKLPGSAPLPVFVRVVEAGDSHAAEAAQLLQAAGPEGSKALLARLLATEEGEAELISTLTSINPRFAARHFPMLLGEAGTERRTQLREALSRLFKLEESRGVLSGWFAPSAESRKLSPGAEVELLRALEPELVHLEGAMGALGRLAESADFERAYLLAPLVVKNFAELEGSRRFLSRFLAGEVAGPPDDQEKAALSVRTLDALLEHGDPSLRGALQDSLSRSLKAENMRVRRAALLNFALTSATPPGRTESIVDLLSRDDWPQVRAAAALAVSFAGEEWDQRTERVVLRRLEKDEDATVRRSLVRALAAASGETVVSSVRRAFEKDEDYSVRAEAAVSLGKLCDMGSVDALTARARQLGSGLTDDGPIELGLSSVTALAYLAPADINKRLAPLLSEKAPRLTRQQVLRRIEAVQASSERELCRR